MTSKLRAGQLSWLGIFTAALLVACSSGGTTDGGTSTDGGTHDAGTSVTDAGIPGAYLSNNAYDGGTDTFQVVSSTLIYYANATDGGVDPTHALLYFSSLSQDQLCDLSRLLVTETGNLFDGLTADVGDVQLKLFPDAGVAFVPGTYVVPDGGVRMSITHRSFVDGGEAILSEQRAATLTVQTVELPTVDFGTLYKGGRFTATVQARYSDGGYLNLQIDAHGCDGQLLEQVIII